MQYRAIQCNIMQYNAITCIIYNCWQSVPLPRGHYEAIFTILNKCWHKTKQILAGCRLRKTGCMCIDSKKVSKWVGLKQQKHCTCFLRLWLTIDIIIVWFPNKEKSNGCKKDQCSSLLATCLSHCTQWILGTSSETRTTTQTLEVCSFFEKRM